MWLNKNQLLSILLYLRPLLLFHPLPILNFPPLQFLPQQAQISRIKVQTRQIGEILQIYLWSHGLFFVFKSQFSNLLQRFLYLDFLFVYELPSFLGIFSKLSFLKERVGEAETPEITGGLFFLNEFFFLRYSINGSDCLLV